jgi:hypothetical protein
MKYRYTLTVEVDSDSTTPEISKRIREELLRARDAFEWDVLPWKHVVDVNGNTIAKEASVKVKIDATISSAQKTLDAAAKAQSEAHRAYMTACDAADAVPGGTEEAADLNARVRVALVASRLSEHATWIAGVALMKARS